MATFNENYIEVQGVVRGPILPSKKSELLREISLRNNFNIQGAVYAHNLVAEGSGIVDGPLLVKREIMLTPPMDYKELMNYNEHMIFRRGIHAGRSILVEINGPKKSSPARDIRYSPLIVRGDISSGLVKLENAIILGNIHCDSAFIKNSIILGSPFVAGKLTIENSSMLSFNAGSVEIMGHNTLLVPYGIARTDIYWSEVDNKNLDTSSGEDRSSTIRYLALCGSQQTGCGQLALTCESYLDGNCRNNGVCMTKADILRVDQEEGACNVLTITPRLLDISSIEEGVEEISKLITNMLMFDHFDEELKQKMLSDAFHPDSRELLEQLGSITLPDSR
jgi:cytoskeletal protein CcmA (bactofilin family)